MTSQYSSFAAGAGANTLSYASYSALSTFISQGFGAGLVESAKFNTVMRQVSVPAAAIAQFAAANGGSDANDDGNVSALATLIQNAVDHRVDTAITHGTFSPVLRIGGSNVGVTYSLQDGGWWRVRATGGHDMMHIWGFLVLSSTGGLTGNVTIGGWGTNAVGSLPVNVLCDQMNSLSGVIKGLSLNGTDTFEVRMSGGTGDGFILDDTYLTSTSRFHFSFTQRV